MKTLTIIIIGLLVCSLVIGVYYLENKNKIKEENDKNKQYQGAVPEGYDEDYFRETGITKPLEIDE